MKKPALLLLFCLSIHLNAQVYNYIAGDVSVHAGVGIQSINWTESDTAGYHAVTKLSGAIYRFSFDFAISRFMGIGFGYAFTNVLSQTRGNASESRISEFTPELTLHLPLNSHLVDLGSAWGMGYAHYRYFGDDTLNSGAYVNAFSFFGEIRPRFFLSRQQTLGIFTWYRIAYNAGHGASGNKNSGWYEFKLSGYSQSAGLGLFYRLGKKRMKLRVDGETNTDQQ